MKKELQDILNRLKNSIEEPISSEYDNYTEECYEMPNFFALDPTTNECKLLNNYITDLKTQLKKQKEINQKTIEYIKSKENGKCIHNGIEKGAYTFVLDFDKAREFIWELLEILEDKEV